MQSSLQHIFSVILLLCPNLCVSSLLTPPPHPAFKVSCQHHHSSHTPLTPDTLVITDYRVLEQGIHTHILLLFPPLCLEENRTFFDADTSTPASDQTVTARFCWFD